MQVSQVQQWMRWYALGLCLMACGMVLGHTLFGRLVVTVLYKGATGTFLDGIITGQHVHSLEHYYRFMDQSILNIVTALCLLALVLGGMSLSSGAWLLTLLLSTDMMFIILGYSYTSVFGWDGSAFILERDWGYAEIFQYSKEFVMLVVFFLFFLRYRYLINLGWQIFFVYIFLDDSLQIHERLGEAITKDFSIASMTYWQVRTMGQMAVSGFFGLLILSLLSIGYYYAESRFRRMSWHLLGLLSILAFFGVIFDMVHVTLDPQNMLLEILEEGGEMSTISVMAWYVHRLTTASDPTP